MLFEEKPILLEDGRQAALRSPAADDAEQMLAYMKTTAEETIFLSRYPEECAETVDNERAFIQRINDAANTVMIVCDVGGRIVGCCQLSGNNRIKTRHRGEVAIGILRDYWGQGIGSAMFTEMIRLAKEWGILQLELDYIEGNHRAKALYEKMGFCQAAVKPNAIRLKDGRMLDEIFMIRKL